MAGVQRDSNGANGAVDELGLIGGRSGHTSRTTSSFRGTNMGVHTGVHTATMWRAPHEVDEGT